MAIIIADGLKTVGRDALDFCKSVQGEVLYHPMYKSKLLLHDILLLNKNCKLTTINSEEVKEIIHNHSVDEINVFYKKHTKHVILASSIGIITFILGLIIGGKIKRTLS